MSKITLKIFSPIVVLICSISISFSQENTPETKTVFQLSEITTKATEASKTISSIHQKIKPLHSVDSIKTAEKHYLDSINDVISSYDEEFIASLNFINLESEHANLQKIINELSEFQENISKKIDIIESASQVTNKELTYWQDVEKFYSEKEDVSTSLLERINSTLSQYQSIQKEIVNVEDTVLAKLNRIHQVQSKAEEKEDILRTQKSLMQRSILTGEQIPFWKIKNMPKDTVGIKKQIVDSVNKDLATARLFINYNVNGFVSHIITIIVLFLIFYLSRNRIKGILVKTNNVKLQLFLNKPLWIAILFSFFFVRIIYDELPNIYVGIFIILLFIPIIQLLNILLNRRFQVYLYLYVAFYLLSIVFDHLNLFYQQERLLFIGYQILIGVVAGIFLRQHSPSLRKKNSPTGNSLLFGFQLIFLLSMGMAFLNFIGFVRLSMLVTIGTLKLIGIGLTLFLIYKITTILIIILLNWKIVNQLNIVSSQKEKVGKRLIAIARLYFIFLFTVNLLKSYSLYKPFIDWWDSFVSKSWEFGESTVTIGDFLSFFTILIFAFLIARFIKYLFGTEILIRLPLKRGVPNAIAVTFYYFILVTGFFLAAFSTGIEWSKVNLAVGALGVGIGFGLQNVVFNFIAGLILIYERPIQVNDIVEVNSLMGRIKEIGIRSSKVLTYDGAEVVVPNGNLISNEVINWTLSNQNKRQELRFRTSYNANPTDVVNILKETTLTNKNVLSDPSPLVLFEGYGSGEGTLEFRVLFWTDLDVGLSTKSNVAIAIFEALQKAGLEIPIQRKSIRIENEKNKE